MHDFQGERQLRYEVGQRAEEGVQLDPLSSRLAGMQGILPTKDLSNVTVFCASRSKLGAFTQSQPYGGNMCRYNESNITMIAFISTLHFLVLFRT